MKDRGIHLQYRFGEGAQRGAEVHNPLFELLSALAAAGSIQQAARALGCSYRHLWGELKRWEALLGETLCHWVRGQPARLTPFAERLLWSERQARVRMAPHIEALRAELQRVLDDALDGTQQVLRIDASHDLALPELRRLAGTRRLHLELRFAGSVDALRSLAEGRCLVAGFHVPPMAAGDDARLEAADAARGATRATDTLRVSVPTLASRPLAPPPAAVYAGALKPLLVPGRHKLISCMRRWQGLMVAPGNPLAIQDLADVAVRRLRFVAREPGSGTRLLVDHLAQATPFDLGTLNIVGTENSHVAAATAVASGAADVALGVQAAAVQAGLHFVPVLQEHYDLVCLADALEQPAVQLLRELIASEEWREALARIPGYESAPDAGAVLSLTRALPWWRFRSARHSQGPRHPTR